MKSDAFSASQVGQSASLRRSVTRNLVLLVAVSGGAILLVTIFGAFHAVRSLSRTLIESTQDRTETELRRFFGSVSRSLLLVKGWGEGGRLEVTDVQKLNTVLTPVLESVPQVSSILVANAEGGEYLLLRTSEGWQNREIRAGDRKNRYWTLRAPDGSVLREWSDTDSYDTRSRPWFRDAMSSPDPSRPSWTAPYEFHTTREPGITASIRWRAGGPEGPQHVVAFDVLLTDISAFTTTLELSANAKAVVTTADGQVVGLPSDPRFEDPRARIGAVLESAESLGVPALSDALTAWVRKQETPEPLRYRSDGEVWWAAFRPFDLSPSRQLWIGVMVPRSDFLREATVVRDIVAGIILLSVVGAVGIAFLVDRSFRKKVDQVVRRARQLGQYHIVRKIGAGGMGTVYLAQHAMLRRPTAVKLLHSSQEHERDAVARFEREVQLTSRLTHPNTIAVFDYGRTDDGIFYYAMEYLDGISLESLVRLEGRVSPARAIYILEQVCGSLEEAHGVGMIHRDIKPANIMLCERGARYDTVKVLDFGLVKDLDADGSMGLSDDSLLTGTPHYMSPESIRAPGDIDARSDLYAVGAVGYYLVTGHRAFEGDTILEVCTKQLREEPVPPSSRAELELPDDLERVIMDCLAKDRDERPRSASVLRERLLACRDAGGWGPETARAWWSEHQEDRAEASDGDDRMFGTGVSSSAHVTIDLRSRQ